MSHDVDFMPASFHRARAHRSRWLWRAGVLVLFAASLLGVGVALKSQSANQRRIAERLEATVEAEQGVLGLVSKLEKQRQHLLSRLELKRELSPAVTFNQVIATLGEALPPGVAIRELVLTTVRPKPEPWIDPALKNAADTRAARQRKDGQTPAKEPHLIGVELDALAPDDMAVAALIATLDQHPLFERVTLRSSRAVETQGVAARQFQLTATVDLDREFDWVRPTEEVADASQ